MLFHSIFFFFVLFKYPTFLSYQLVSLFSFLSLLHHRHLFFFFFLSVIHVLPFLTQPHLLGFHFPSISCFYFIFSFPFFLPDNVFLSLVLPLPLVRSLLLFIPSRRPNTSSSLSLSFTLLQFLLFNRRECLAFLPLFQSTIL